MQIVRDITIVSEDVQNPINLTEAKNYLRVDYNEDDDLIESLITTSRIRLEQYAGIAMTERTLQVVAYVESFIELPYVPITNILDVEYYNNGTWVSIEEGAYQVIGITTPKILVISYPNMEYRFTYNCGYSCVPSSIKTATLKMLSDLYEYRESSVEASKPSANLTTAYELMKPFKRINVIL